MVTWETCQRRRSKRKLQSQQMKGKYKGPSGLFWAFHKSKDLNCYHPRHDVLYYGGWVPTCPRYWYFTIQNRNKMKATISSEKLITNYNTLWCHTPEEYVLNVALFSEEKILHNQHTWNNGLCPTIQTEHI